MIFKQLFLLSLLVAPASAFVSPQSAAHHGNLVRHMSAVGGDKEDAVAKSSSFDMDDMVSKVKNFDVDGLLSKLNFDFESFDLQAIKSNLMDGTVGERGETYAVAQLALLGCIIGGGIPLIGNALMLLLGPCLMVAGAATVALSIKDLGNNLSPWAVPPAGGALVQEGIYSVIRHPLYAGLAAFSAGFSILTGSASSLLLTSALFYVFNVVAEKEEEELVKKYPEYDSYSNNVVGRFFPDELAKQLPWNQDM